MGLNEDLARWGLASEKCGLCNREKEDLPHFMFKCTKMNHIRTKYVYMLENQLKECGMEHIWYKYIGSSTLRKLSFLLGEEGFDYGKMVGSMFDFISKKFLIEAWCHRRELLNNAPDPT